MENVFLLGRPLFPASAFALLMLFFAAQRRSVSALKVFQ
jgi:hypothetical protein